MIRGNRALKRGVAISAAFATAIAGAVLAAPAASAFTEPNDPPVGGFSGTSPVDLTDIVRAQPINDADWIDAAGNAIPATGTSIPANTYSGAAGGTGVAEWVNVGEEGQDADGMQIRLPLVYDGGANTLFATWKPGDRFTISLPTGVTFAETPTVESTGLVELGQLNELAGYGGSYYDIGTPGDTATAHQLQNVVANLTTGAAGSAPNVNVQKPNVTITASGSTATIEIHNNLWNAPPTPAAAFHADSLTSVNVGTYEGNSTNGFVTVDKDGKTPGAAAAPGFLLNISGVKLNVAEGTLGGAVGATVRGSNSNLDYGTVNQLWSPATAALVCATAPTPRTSSYVGGTTTIAWVVPVGITVDVTDSLVPNAGIQPLPTVTLNEDVPNGWQNGNYMITGTETTPGGTVYAIEFDDPDLGIASLDANADGTSSTVTVKNFTLSVNEEEIHFDVTAQDSSKIEDIVINNLRLNWNVDPNSTVELTITPVLWPYPAKNLNSLACGATASAFSYSPDGLVNFTATDEVLVAPESDRIAGANRYDTARLIAQQYAGETFGDLDPEYDGGDVLIVANGEDYKEGFDALAANYLAGRVEAPILLTQSNRLPAYTAEAIRSYLGGADQGDGIVYVMGKDDSVSAKVKQEIADIFHKYRSNVRVVEVSGSNRYGTAVAAATAENGTASDVGKVSFEYGKPALRTAILASGEVNADALSAGALSYSENLPIFLAQADRLPGATAQGLQTLGIQQLIVLGGTDRISDAVVAETGIPASRVVRIAGSDRTETSTMLYDLAMLRTATPTRAEGGFNQNLDNAFLANGTTGWADALSVGPLAGESDAALILTRKSSLTDAVSDFFLNHNAKNVDLTLYRGDIDEITGLGQNDQITQTTLDAANALLGKKK